MRRRPSRSDYKRVWTKLGRTEESAIVHVVGQRSEEEIAALADETRLVLARTVGLRAADVVLEIGCGIGRVGRAVAPLVRQWVGADVAPTMLAHARRRLRDLENVRFVEISGHDLGPFATESLDVVYSTIVFMHLDEWDRHTLTLEAYRTLRPGGRFYADNFNLLSDEGWKVFERHRTMYWPHERPAHISKSSTPQELTTYFMRAGFDDIDVEEDGLWVRAYGTKPG